MRLAQQEVDGRVDAGIGQFAQPPHGDPGVHRLRQFRQGDQHVRLALERAQPRHQDGFRDIGGEWDGGDLRVDRGKPIVKRGIEQPIQDFRAPADAIAQERRKIESRAEKALDGPLACQQFGQARQFGLGGGLGDIRQLPRGVQRVERHHAMRRPAEPVERDGGNGVDYRRPSRLAHSPAWMKLAQ